MKGTTMQFTRFIVKNGKLMNRTRFNLSNKPQLEWDFAAYFVDENNVDLIRQYIEKYYQQFPAIVGYKSWLNWFNELIGKEIKTNHEKTFIIYFRQTELGYDYGDEAVAYDEGYQLYYVDDAKKCVENQ